MTEKSPAFQFYPKDLLSDGKAMAMPFHVLGIYWKLLCHDWIDDGLPDDDDELLAMAGYYPTGKVEKRNVMKRLREKFIKHPTKQEFITNPRLLKEREKQVNNSKNKSEAGKKGAKKRWQDHDSANSKPITDNSSSLLEEEVEGEIEEEVKSNEGYIFKSNGWDLNLAMGWAEWFCMKFGESLPDWQIDEWGQVIKDMRVMDKRIKETIAEKWEWTKTGWWQENNIRVTPKMVREKWLTIKSPEEVPKDKPPPKPNTEWKEQLNGERPDPEKAKAFLADFTNKLKGVE